MIQIPEDVVKLLKSKNIEDIEVGLFILIKDYPTFDSFHILMKYIRDNINLEVGWRLSWRDFYEKNTTNE